MKVKQRFHGYKFHPLNWIWLNHLVGIIKFRRFIKETKKQGYWNNIDNLMVKGYWIKY